MKAHPDGNAHGSHHAEDHRKPPARAHGEVHPPLQRMDTRKHHVSRGRKRKNPLTEADHRKQEQDSVSK